MSQRIPIILFFFCNVILQNVKCDTPNYLIICYFDNLTDQNFTRKANKVNNALPSNTQVDIPYIILHIFLIISQSKKIEKC